MIKTQTLVQSGILSVLLLALSSMVLADSSSSEDKAAFSGSYKTAATAAEKEARQKAVDKTVSEFFVVTRPIARKKIEKKTHIAETLTIKQSDKDVTIHFEGRDAEVCPFKGSKKGKDPDGVEAEFAARWEGDKLVQTVTTEEGKRTNTFALQADGSIKLTAELASEKFEAPIRYTVTYRKGS